MKSTDMYNLQSNPSWTSETSRFSIEEPSRKRKGGYTETSPAKRSCSASPVEQSISPNESCTSSTGVQAAFSKVLEITDVPDIDLTTSDRLDDGNDSADLDRSNRSCSSYSLCSEGSSELIHVDIEEFDAVELEISPSKKGFFIPKNVPRGCLVAKFAEFFRFTPYVISQGTSYFQRLATIDPWLRQAAASQPDFAMFVQDIPPCKLSDCRKSPLGTVHRVHGDRIWCLVIHLTCIYLAAKVLDTITCAYLLQTILCHVHHCKVTKEQSLALEAETLVALEWRLGPYFSADQ